MKTVSAIPTIYSGIKFRSRLEARWAVFMDCLGVKWEYEPEGFTDGELCYLPDFWLRELGLYLEIKPEEPSTQEVEKARMIVDGTGEDLLFGIGRPSDKAQILVISNEKSYEDTMRFAIREDRRTSGEFWLLDEKNHTGCSIGPIYGPDHGRWPILSVNIQRAIFASSNHRFGKIA